MDDPIPWERLVAADRTAAKLAALLLAWQAQASLRDQVALDLIGATTYHHHDSVTQHLLQISNPSQQNQRGCLLSTGPLYFLYF